MTPFRLLLLLAVLDAPVAASAQNSTVRVPGPNSSALRSPAVPKPLHPNWIFNPSDSVAKIRPTYWKEGAVVGGAVGAVGFGLMVGAICGLSESETGCTGKALLGGLVGGVVMAVPGALIGGLFPKAPRKAEHEAAE
ncbi:MAG: hypothetical protein ABI785_05230 [Gemmatimonadales bacterium]